MKLKQIIQNIDSRFPFALQEKWDNSGLQIGDLEAKIESVLIGVDLTEELLAMAVKSSADLIITHHPLFFTPIKKLDFSSLGARKIRTLILSNISLLSVHTNIDSAHNGINDALLSLFSVNSVEPLIPSGERTYKIAVYTPAEHAEAVMSALNEGGAATIGNYDNCFFCAEGTGSFRGNDSSNPAYGTPGIIEKVQELKIETVCKERFLKTSLRKMLDAHPYEEVAHDVYEIRSGISLDGIGRIARLTQKRSDREITDILKKADYKDIRIEHAGGNAIRTIAVSCGSAAGEIAKACLTRKADLLITGEIRYHDYLELQEHGIAVAVLGHPQSEKVFCKIMKRNLEDFFSGKITIECDPSCYSTKKGNPL